MPCCSCHKKRIWPAPANKNVDQNPRVTLRKMSRDPIPPDIVQHPPESPRTRRTRLELGNRLFAQGLARARMLQATGNGGQGRRHEQQQRGQEKEEERQANQAVSEASQQQAQQHFQASLQESQRILCHLEAGHRRYRPVIDNGIYGPIPMINPDLFSSVSQLQNDHAQQVNMQRASSPVAYFDPQSLSAYTSFSPPESASGSSSAGSNHGIIVGQLPAQARLDHLGGRKPSNLRAGPC